MMLRDTIYSFFLHMKSVRITMFFPAAKIAMCRVCLVDRRSHMSTCIALCLSEAKTDGILK
jgi:hypothetical protein